MPSIMTDELDNVVVLVTRPAHQAGKLVELIERHGGQALQFPALEIEAQADHDKIASAIGDITDYDVAIFVSVNAVQHGVSFLPESGKRPLLAVIGPSTARALADAGFECDIRSEHGFTSEALLSEAELANIDGQKIVIFRGVGGRAYLGDELARRGATVVYAEVYRRDRPEEFDAEIAQKLAATEIDAITATSAETLVNLYEMAPEHAVAGLLDTQLVTASVRVVKKAAALGFTHPALLAEAAGDEALVERLIDWRHEQRRAAGTAERETSQLPTSEQTTNQMGSTPDMSETTIATGATGNDAVKKTAADVYDAPVTPPSPAPPVATRSRGGGVLSLIAILFSLAAMAGSAYVWMQLRESGSDASAGLGATVSAIEETRRELATLDAKVDQSLSDVSRLVSGGGRQSSQIDDLRSAVETLTARVQSSEKSIDDVRGVSASARNNWVRAEAEYFLQAANSRLQLARDPDSAMAALLAADDRLKSLGDPSLFRVRQQLAVEIEALKSVPRPDVEGIAHTLSGLASRVNTLALRNSNPEPFRDADGGSVEGATAVDKAMSTLKGVFSEMVSVKRTDEQIKPLLSRDEEFFLQRNLELQLQTARLALLRGDAANYRESLRTARTWVQDHFLTDDATVASTLATLARLEGEIIAPELPDISGSLRQLRLTAPNDAGETG